MKFLRNLNIIAVVCLAIAMVSCGGLNSEQEDFDEAMLVGKWVNDRNSQEYYVFEDSYSGYTWDEGDDVSEYEAMCDPNSMFTWLMSGSTLTIIYSTTMTGGISIPKIYSLSKLTSSELVYHDLFSTYSFTRTY